MIDEKAFALCQDGQRDELRSLFVEAAETAGTGDSPRVRGALLCRRRRSVHRIFIPQCGPLDSGETVRSCCTCLRIRELCFHAWNYSKIIIWAQVWTAEPRGGMDFLWERNKSDMFHCFLTLCWKVGHYCNLINV